MFREFEPTALFHYLRSFRRIRVDFESHLSASKAKVSMDNTPVGDSIMHCYFIQVRKKKTSYISVLVFCAAWQGVLLFADTAYPSQSQYLY